MKIYSYVNVEHFSNCYLVTNDASMQVILIDPCKMNPTLLAQIESGPYTLDAVLITHNHTGHTGGVSGLRKIYDPKVYAADYEVAQEQTVVIKDDGDLYVAGMNVRYASVPGHSFDSMVFQIGHIIFTGDVLSGGLMGSTYSSYAKNTLVAAVEAKILSQDESFILLPGHGPPTTIGAEKKFNLDLKWNDPQETFPDSGNR
jgi:glyoxylase-like metal-dependent hydrolase (beta-lactamase superfamily II)